MRLTSLRSAASSGNILRCHVVPIFLFFYCQKNRIFFLSIFIFFIFLYFFIIIKACRHYQNDLDGSKSLNLSGFGLRRIPKFIWKDPSIRKLNLRDNQLTSLPPDIENLVSLEILILSNNKLETLPAELGHITTLTTLAIDQNPLTSFPSSDVVPRKTCDILRFLRNLNSRDLTWPRVKVMIVGPENVGKTTITGRLSTGKSKLSERPGGKGYVSTEGIDIVEWLVDGRGIEEDRTFHIWDFGGQEVFYPTHQLFLTSRAVYLVVCRLDSPEFLDKVIFCFWVFFTLIFKLIFIEFLFIYYFL